MEDVRVRSVTPSCLGQPELGTRYRSQPSAAGPRPAIEVDGIEPSSAITSLPYRGPLDVLASPRRGLERHAQQLPGMPYRGLACPAAACQGVPRIVTVPSRFFRAHRALHCEVPALVPSELRA